MSKQNKNSAKNIFINAGGIVSTQKNFQNGNIDFVVKIDGINYAAMIKTLFAPRTEDVLGRFSTLILQSRDTVPPHTIPLLVVAASQWGAPMIDKVREHMQKYAQNTSWALIENNHGAIHLERALGNGRVSPFVWYADTPMTTESNSSYGTTLFTDLNAWLLKVLIYKSAPEPFHLDLPAMIKNPNHLAKEANVSVRTAYSFFNAFSKMDFVRTSKSEGIHLVRTSALLDLWINEAIKMSPVRTHACSIFGHLDNWEELLSASGNLKFALGGFGACRKHGVLHTNASPVWDVYVSDGIHKFEKAWNLQSCGEKDAQINFIESTDRSSVFRSINSNQPVPVVDLIQSALDVAPLPGRGREQAEHIAQIVNSWELS